MMNSDDDTRDDELSAHYRKADDAVPSAALDESILAAARQAVEHNTANHRLLRSPFSGRWPIAVSAAAVVVIAIMLVPLLERQAPPVETAPPSVMDDRHNKVEQAEAKKAVRERLPTSSPGWLYAPSPAPIPVLQQQSAIGESAKEEDSVNAAGRSSAAAPASTFKEHRAQARLNAASGAPLAIFTPEMWLVKIQQLIDSGKIREAADELDKFRQAHPDYKLDQNLLERLKQP